MKNAKKILAALLVLAIALTGTVSVAAYTGSSNIDAGRLKATSTDSKPSASTPTDTTPTDTTPTDVPDNSDGIVARMYMCYSSLVRASVGHCWIYIENLCDHNLKVGAYDLPPEQGVSIGCFLNTVSDGGGVYYNLESRYMNEKAQKTKTFQIHKDIDEKTLKRVSDHINRNNFWTPITNCQWFAAMTWNVLFNRLQFPIGVPVITMPFFLLIYRPEQGIEMYYPQDDQILRHRGIGSSSYAEPATETMKQDYGKGPSVG